MPRFIVIAISLMVFLLGAALVAANGEHVRVDLLVADIELTKGQWMVVTFALGWLAGVASAWRFVRRLTNERAALRRALRLTEAEIKNLRPLSHDRG